MRVSYLPPLMVYLAAGVSGLTAIVGTFFVKDYLGLSAEFLAALAFWAGIPWTLKMPFGHIVDLLWRWKSLFVFVGAGLIATDFVIMLGLIGRNQFMLRFMSAEAWYVLGVLLAPLGYVVQDVVADAMTVEAVPTVDDQGLPYDPAVVKQMHTTMQTLGRAAIVGGGILVSVVNIVMFSGVAGMSEAEKVSVYLDIYTMAMVIPAISVLGVIIAWFLRGKRVKDLRGLGFEEEHIQEMLGLKGQKTEPNLWILGGSLVFVAFTLAMGLGTVPFDQEIVFAGSMGIVLFLMARLLRELSLEDRRSLVGTALIIFVFRALPGPGAGSTWWQIDELGFDQQFISNLSLISSSFALLGMFIFRRFMAERSIAYVVGFLTVAGTVLSLPIIGLYYGIHHWTSALTGGLVDARFIAVVDTALESPLGQVAMIPMLAWIAQSAPPHLKATFFAVMASFTNLALSMSSLGTKYLNQVYVVSRRVVDAATGDVKVPADYSQLGVLLVTVTILGFVWPMMTIWVVQKSRIRSKA
ncbi:MAG: folate/biopterin family MFS transporter [Deltaproteobacteria bacterium]|nr:folate/biopterin family MFS transporter [Deltaproteobacteria bacterium]